ncbi:MAG: hypothetical protein PHE55_06865 [Methylococcaceae bacterium]|nr:hypothetical protein [Methylococcaceae bacterium]
MNSTTSFSAKIYRGMSKSPYRSGIANDSGEPYRSSFLLRPEEMDVDVGGQLTFDDVEDCCLSGRPRGVVRDLAQSGH